MELYKNGSQKVVSKPRSTQDFRLFLQDQLNERCQKNSNYSLRAFAKMLDISASALSALLSGKRPISHKMKMRLGLKLGLGLEALNKLSSKDHGNKKENSLGFKKPKVETHFQQITIDMFNVIAEPHYYNLLELTKTHDFQWDEKWIAQRLDLMISQVKIAIERLERVGLLIRNSENQLVDSTDGFSTDIREGLSSHAQRLFQQRSLEQSIKAVQAVPVELRDNTSMTMAINSEDIPKAKEFLKQFRRQFCQEMEANPKLDQVYQLTISFIPVTQILGGKK